MEIKILRDRKEKPLFDLPVGTDVYFEWPLLEFDAETQKGELEIFTAKAGDSFFYYPYVKLQFDNTSLNTYRDIISPYGYSGPFTNDPLFFEEAEQEFVKYASGSFVTELVRYHYNVLCKFSINCENIHDRTIVVGQLDKSWDEIFMKDINTINRNIFRKMQKEGYEFTFSENESDWEDFIALYYQTMKNAEAGGFYYFEKEKILKLKADMDKKITLAMIKKEGIVYSAALFFLAGPAITYFLSARNLTYHKIPATNYLLMQMAKWGQASGFKRLVYGGGLSNRPDDSLFKFKKGFSSTQLPFYIGKRVHNTAVYKELTESFIKEKGEETYAAKKHFLQFYRN